MKIILAGCNFDLAAIDAAKAGSYKEESLTPETIAAAYARISRDPRPVNELREAAMTEVEKARASNRNIAFAMGHSSIAEHAVFNIDILGVSRLLVEEIERSRLASFTEKSQRYVLLKDDFVVPQEIKEAGIEASYTAAIRAQNDGYHKLYERLRSHVFEKHAEMAEQAANRSLLESWAKEDARYVISLATETQLGMTINARSLELMIRRLTASPLFEAREAASRLYEVAAGIAPSLIKYVEPTDYERRTRSDLKEMAEALKEEWPPSGGKRDASSPIGGEDVVLVFATADADNMVVAALLQSESDLSMGKCLEMARQMTGEEKEDFVKTAFRHLRFYDAVPREFECVDFHFELAVSSTCFAQLKRHRMATIISQDYSPALGVTVPPAIREADLENDFMDIIARTEEAYGEIKKVAPEAANYILTNAHRRRVLLKVNAREFYHIARLRSDKHAQWDIRRIADRMTELGRKAMPLTLMLATGKDGFDALYSQVFD